MQFVPTYVQNLCSLYKQILPNLQKKFQNKKSTNKNNCKKLVCKICATYRIMGIFLWSKKLLHGYRSIKIFALAVHIFGTKCNTTEKSLPSDNKARADNAAEFGEEKHGF
jgi:hypothetical protein